MTIDKNKFCVRLKAARLLGGKTQAQCAAAIDMDKAQYSRYESGKTEPTIEQGERLAESVGMNLADLIGETK